MTHQQSTPQERTVNQLHSEYAIEDDVTESELVDADCRITNLQERNFPTTADSERLLERDSIDELKYFTLNLNIDGEMQETSISIVALTEDSETTAFVSKLSDLTVQDTDDPCSMWTLVGRSVKK